ncbi:MAG: hypothetical protein AB8B91_22575 [Rubripirellula sp.]
MNHTYNYGPPPPIEYYGTSVSTPDPLHGTQQQQSHSKMDLVLPIVVFSLFIGMLLSAKKEPATPSFNEQLGELVANNWPNREF